MKKRTTTENTSYENYGIDVGEIPISSHIIAWLLLICLLMFGCGAKKIDQRQEEKEVKTELKEVVKNDIVTDKKENTIIKVFINDSVKEEIEEIENVNVDGSKTIKRKIKRNKSIKTESNTNTQLNEKTNDKTNKNTLQSKQTKESNKTKNLDRKQFDPISFLISYWWLWLIVLLVFIIFKKFKDKLWFI